MTKELKQIFEYLNNKDSEVILLGIELFKTNPIYQVFKNRYFKSKYRQNYISGKQLIEFFEDVIGLYKILKSARTLCLYYSRIIKKWVKRYNHKQAVYDFWRNKTNN